MQAALDGTKEIALAVLATTATIVAVFLPVAFVPGMVGQFFRQFGITISAAVVLSLFVAFTLDPMLSSRFSKSAAADSATRFAWLKRPFHWFFANLEATYRRMLGWSVRHKLVVGALAIGSLVFMGFIAEAHRATTSSTPRTAGSSWSRSSCPPAPRWTRPRALSARGRGGAAQAPRRCRRCSPPSARGGEVNKVRWRVVTTPKNERTETLAELKDDARAGRGASPARAPRSSSPTPPFVEGAATEAPIMINVRGEELRRHRAGRAQDRATSSRARPGVQDIQVRYSPGRPELRVAIDRERAADRGLTVAPLAHGAARGDGGRRGRQAAPGRGRGPDPRAPDEERPRAARGSGQPARCRRRRGPVALGDVARFTRGEGPQVIERENRNAPDRGLGARRSAARWATSWPRSSRRSPRSSCPPGAQHLLRRPSA